MKRLLAFAAVLSLFSVSAMAAKDEAGGHFGIQGGINFANTSNTPNVATSSLTGFSIGVAMESPLLPGLVYIQPELNFIQKGNEVASAFKTRLSYVELPVNVKVKFEINGVKPYVMAGPKVGYLVGTSFSTSGGGATATGNTDDFNKVDFGVNLGAGAGFNVAESMELFLTAQYGVGLTNISKIANVTAKNNTFQVLAGLLF